MRDKIQRIFVDTNIFVYARDSSAGDKYSKAKQLVCNLWRLKEGCLSIQVLQELYVTLTKKIPNPMKSDTAASVVSDLGQWIVHSPETEDILQAINIQHKYGLSFWDSMIICSAARLNCEKILSEDLNAGQVYEGIKVINPLG